MRKVPVLLAAATLIPMVTLCWLGLRSIQQDRALEKQRRRDALEVSAGRLALEIERSLHDIEERLAGGDGIPLAASADRESPAALFSNGEAAEFQRQDLKAAVAVFQRLAQSPSRSTRAAALVRLARVLRKTGNSAGALQAYSNLEGLGAITVGGEPAALLGKEGRCRVLEEMGDTSGLRREARDLARTLDSGAWSIDAAAFDLYRGMAQQWGASPPSQDTRARIESEMELRHSWAAGGLPARGRRILHTKDGPVLAAWNGPTSWLATRSEFDALLRSLSSPRHLRVSLYDTDGQVVFGEAGVEGVSLTPGETRLPFILRVASAPAVETGDTILVTTLVMALVLMLAAAYGLYRTTSRELLLARQQADFVSAVSHEFRTPLTSMRHLTEMLASRGVTSEERKAQYYELLARETERLHRMVESLLSLGRIEVGAYAWRLEPADVAQLVECAVKDFREESQGRDRTVSCEIEPDLSPIRADREALSRALWNLLENAAKYSEPDSPIRVFVRRQRDAVLLAVEDRGIGIPAGERERIFQKFVRGAEAKRAGIRGVGVGLALVKRIAEAHGGSVRLESEPGHGSTFTLVLPCPEF